MFRYRVEYFDDIEGNVIESGLVGGGSYEQAVKAIVEYYGIPASIQITLYSDTVIFPYSDMKEFFESSINE